MKRFFLILCSFSLKIFGESFDVEKLPMLRTQQYPIHSFEKIALFSLPRTGSSLVYNIFRYLFEAPENFSYFHNEFNLNCLVLKTQRFEEIKQVDGSPIIYIVTIRNPIDSITSHYRIYSHKIHNIQNFVKFRIAIYMEFLKFYEDLRQKGKDVLFLKYEDFAENIDYIFDRIESRFAIHIDQADRILMQKGYGRENVLSSVELFPDFEGYWPLSGFHGQHIKSDTYKPPKELTYWIEKLIEQVKPEFRKYGYFLD